MADQKPQISPAALAAFLAGAGLGAGTTVTITTPGDAPDAGSGWKCEVLTNKEVLCAPFGAVVIADDITVRDTNPDAGTPDAGK